MVKRWQGRAMHDSARFSCISIMGSLLRDISALSLVCDVRGAVQKRRWNSPLSTSFPLAPRQGHGSAAGNSWERWGLEYDFLLENEQMDLGHVGWGSCESSGHQRHVEALKKKIFKAGYLRKRVFFLVLRVFIFKQERFICHCVKLFCEFTFFFSSGFPWVTT